ncbi:hypothetical protein [Halothermothrix orenii]|uniref:Uncharacterized protein n=1 Tax=Halothermothrix orenii (strain H 168 / OCM 544 / DSM 9562) TaxID=373903 RepID=B8D0R1_HALOH|nr:hypothetical protein [Halothermothrix orenii]ACL70997.1 hypothetical protein Hore_22520 [Halothermothrix orenii H 168]
MEERKKIREALKETEILKFPDKLISPSQSTTLHYFVLAEPYYLEVLENEGPETKVREGKITWEKPKLLTPGYVLNMEGFSKEAKKALQLMSQNHPDLAGFLYKMNYKKESLRTFSVSKSIEQTSDRIKDEIKEKGDTMTAIIKGIDELWDVSLMKLVQELIIKSMYKSQIPYYEDRGFLSTDDKGYYVVTRNLEGLPIAVSEEIEKMFDRVKSGDLDPSVLKRELDRWGVFEAYQDRFFDLFRKGGGR